MRRHLQNMNPHNKFNRDNILLPMRRSFLKSAANTSSPLRWLALCLFSVATLPGLSQNVPFQESHYTSNDIHKGKIGAANQLAGLEPRGYIGEIRISYALWAMGDPIHDFTFYWSWRAGNLVVGHVEQAGQTVTVTTSDLEKYPDLKAAFYKLKPVSVTVTSSIVFLNNAMRQIASGAKTIPSDYLDVSASGIPGMSWSPGSPAWPDFFDQLNPAPVDYEKSRDIRGKANKAIFSASQSVQLHNPVLGEVLWPDSDLSDILSEYLNREKKALGTNAAAGSIVTNAVAGSTVTNAVAGSTVTNAIAGGIRPNAIAGGQSVQMKSNPNNINIPAASILVQKTPPQTVPKTPPQPALKTSPQPAPKTPSQPALITGTNSGLAPGRPALPKQPHQDGPISADPSPKPAPAPNPFDQVKSGGRASPEDLTRAPAVPNPFDVVRSVRTPSLNPNTPAANPLASRTQVENPAPQTGYQAHQDGPISADASPKPAPAPNPFDQVKSGGRASPEGLSRAPALRNPFEVVRSDKASPPDASAPAANPLASRTQAEEYPVPQTGYTPPRQTYQPGQTMRQTVPGHAYQSDQSAGQPFQVQPSQPLLSARQPGYQTPPQPAIQRTDQAQNIAEQQRQATQERQRQLEEQREAQQERQRQAEAQREAQQERQRQAEAEREAQQERQRQAEAQREAQQERQRQLEEQRAAQQERQRQLEEQVERQREAAQRRSTNR
jgi:hypothetical protein